MNDEADEILRGLNDLILTFDEVIADLDDIMRDAAAGIDCRRAADGSRCQQRWSLGRSRRLG